MTIFRELATACACGKTSEIPEGKHGPAVMCIEPTAEGFKLTSMNYEYESTTPFCPLCGKGADQKVPQSGCPTNQLDSELDSAPGTERERPASD